MQKGFCPPEKIWIDAIWKFVKLEMWQHFVSNFCGVSIFFLIFYNLSCDKRKILSTWSDSAGSVFTGIHTYSLIFA